MIRFRATPFKIGTWTVIRFPQTASAQLPSRGMTMISGSLNGVPLRVALEPDGKGSHWFKLDGELRKIADVTEGRPVDLAVESTKLWPEPEIPADLQKALAADVKARALWADITPMARWDWLRWIRATKQQETRTRRVDVALSKLKSGDRRPCCFNRTMCTEPYVSKNGVLLDPAASSNA